MKQLELVYVYDTKDPEYIIQIITIIIIMITEKNQMGAIHTCAKQF